MRSMLRLIEDRFCVVMLQQVQMALVLHGCECNCCTADGRVQNTKTKRWLLFGRATGFPHRIE